jgi:hypothetical protein
MTPFIELSDGRTIVAADGADEVEPAADGKSLRVVWRRWALVGSKAGQLVDPHITSEVVWRLESATLTRDETLKSTMPVSIRGWWVAVPTTGERSEMLTSGMQRWDIFHFGQSGLAVAAKANWPLEISLLATGDTALGRGARGPLPLHLIYESRDLRLAPNQNAHWRLSLKVAAPQTERTQLAKP